MSDTDKLVLAVKAINYAIDVLEPRVWADTAQGHGIGGQMMMGECDEAYRIRVSNLQRELHQALIAMDSNE